MRSATAAIESVVDVDLEVVEMQTKRKRIRAEENICISGVTSNKKP